jgi:hypothetical protein
MADNLSLGEYIAGAQRSMGGRSQNPMTGYLFSPDFFRKSALTVSGSLFAVTYGKKVWDSLNNKTAFFNAIKKVDWGGTVGWRLRTVRGTGRSRPITETGALPTVDASTYVGVYSYPRTVGTTFGVTLKAQAVSALEGGVGNQLAVEQEAASRDHIKEINQELTSGTAYLTSGTTSAKVNFYVPNAVAGSFHVGDQVGLARAGSEIDSTETITVTAIGTAGGSNTLITTDARTGDYTDGDCVFIKARAGMTSLDDIAHADAMSVGGVTMTALGSDIYNLTTRTAGGYAAGAMGTASYNAGVGRDLTIALVDQSIRTIRQRGGEPKLIVMGPDQWDRFSQLLQPQQRYMEWQDYVVGVGDERTYPGTRGGMQLMSYRGIPILVDYDLPASVATDDSVLGTNVYVIDTDFLEIAVMYPTQYIENRDYFQATSLTMRGLFFTMMEMRSLRPDTTAKICDLNA